MLAANSKLPLGSLPECPPGTDEIGLLSTGGKVSDTERNQMAIDVQKLWDIPTPANTTAIPVRRICGHTERYPFEGVEESNGYRMPKSEADRLVEMRLQVCVECDGDRD